jgi:hypothetical protein
LGHSKLTKAMDEEESDEEASELTLYQDDLGRLSY